MNRFAQGFMEEFEKIAKKKKDEGLLYTTEWREPMTEEEEAEARKARSKQLALAGATITPLSILAGAAMGAGSERPGLGMAAGAAGGALGGAGMTGAMAGLPYLLPVESYEVLRDPSGKHRKAGERYGQSPDVYIGPSGERELPWM